MENGPNESLENTFTEDPGEDDLTDLTTSPNGEEAETSVTEGRFQDSVSSGHKENLNSTKRSLTCYS
uniref:Uncharacterized protein n=1 Tax=Ditylenchus dipsaci TaxID=166011 RepID=A0A915D526_9BILA